MIDYIQDLKKNLKRNPTAKIGLCIVLLVFLTMLFAPIIAPYDPEKISIKDRLKPPLGFKGGSSEHLLGTDGNGRDILSRIIYGSRVSMTIGILCSFLSAAFGTLMGMLAGYYSGRVDSIIMRVGDTLLAFPAIVLGIIIVAVVGQGMVSVIFALSTYMWVWFARTVRGEVLYIKEIEYIEASKACGASNFRIIFTHILPNCISVTIVLASMQIGHVVILETALSFFGMSGLKASWGYDIALGRVYLDTAWWACTIPGLACFFSVMGFNMVGDWIRDSLDPKCY
ncbi:MAG: ABC transporter permease [bacterium]